VLESIKQYIYSELIYKKYYKGIYNESNWRNSERK
jgi:hypothetical protein